MENHKTLFILKGLSLGMCLYMIYQVVVTSLQSNLAEAIPVLNQYPWFVTTIIDFYFNVAIIAIWVVYKEANFLKGLLWIVSFVVLGSISTAFYLFWQLQKLKPGETFKDALVKKG